MAKKNLGLSQSTKFPGMIRGWITTPENFVIAPADFASASLLDAALQDALKDGIAQRIYLWPFFKNIEDLSEETIYEDTPLAVMQVRDGRYGWKGHIKEDINFHKAAFTHRSNSGRVILFDDKNQLIGTMDEDGNFMGFNISMLHTEKMKFSDGSVSTKTIVYLVLSDNDEFDQDGYIIPSTIAKVVNKLDRLTDVEIAFVGVPTTATAVISVKTKADQLPVNGLVTADFSLVKASDGSQMAKTVAETGDGIYTITPTTVLVDGTADLVDAASLTLDAYENPDGALTLNV